MLPHVREFRIVLSQFSVAFKGQRRLQQFPFTRLINFFHDLFLLSQREQLSQRSFFHFIFPLYLGDDNVLDLLRSQHGLDLQYSFHTLLLPQINLRLSNRLKVLHFLQVQIIVIPDLLPFVLDISKLLIHGVDLDLIRSFLYIF